MSNNSNHSSETPSPSAAPIVDTTAETQKVPRRSRKKQEIPVEMVKNETSANQKLIDSTELKSLIRDALLAQAEETNQKFYRERCAQAVISTLGEFMQCYALVGYDLDGTPIRIVSAKTGLEVDAISSALQKFIINMHNGMQ